MYAFALWDKQNKKLFLCRDRFGEKPIYYYLESKEVMFSSEIKSLLVNPNFEKNLNTLSVQSYIKYGFVGGFDSIFNNTKKIKPGHFVEFKFDKLNKFIDNEYCYWNPIDVARESKQNQEHSENIILEKLEEKLNDSVSERIIADVDLGSFLSGGIDSSLISSIMKQVSPNKINTFTVKTEDKKI